MPLTLGGRVARVWSVYLLFTEHHLVPALSGHYLVAQVSPALRGPQSPKTWAWGSQRWPWCWAGEGAGACLGKRGCSEQVGACSEESTARARAGGEELTSPFGWAWPGESPDLLGDGVGKKVGRIRCVMPARCQA